ncbi:unnamed protein product [Agarophyton chilense]
MKLLVGDIGGTNARLVLYEGPDDPGELNDYKQVTSHKVISQKFYKTNEFVSFTEVLCAFFALPANANGKVHCCCLAVAGPVANNHINFTNREGWIIDGHAIEEEFGIDSVLLINDFVANGYGLLSLTEEELVTLQQGNPSAPDIFSAPVALIGAGTGLGECFLTPDKDGKVTAYATEGGHVEFAPRSKLEQELLSFLQIRLATNPGVEHDSLDEDMLPRVSVERLVSGKGLENIYEFLREKYPDQVNESLDEEYQKSTEKGRLIGSLKYNYHLFMRALQIMFGIYGGEVGNVALKYLPYGGVYIAGGIAPKNIEFITSHDSDFMLRFGDKGRMSSLMPEFPVHVVMKEDLGLRGAHNLASQNAAKLVPSQKTEAVSEKDAMAEDVPQKLPRESGLSMSQAIREAVTSYPLTYAVVASTTAALTAAVCVGGLQILRNMKRF